MGAFIDRFLTKTAASVVLCIVVILLLGVTQKLADNITLKELSTATLSSNFRLQ